jgi:hypothetical protein
MSADRHVVTAIPLVEIWDASGPVAARRGPRVGDPDIRRLLQGARLVQFVVADAVGAPLRWVPPAEARAFWRFEVRPRIVLADAARLDPDAYPGRYCYVATRWTREEPESLPLVLLERHR